MKQEPSCDMDPSSAFINGGGGSSSVLLDEINVQGALNSVDVSNAVCFNPKCKSASSSCCATKPGWMLRSGLIVDLCQQCGVAYEQNCFCVTFHADETGWRQCTSCKQEIHCGCIVSFLSYILLDTGGIKCLSCANREDSSKQILGRGGLFLPEDMTLGKLDKSFWPSRSRNVFQSSTLYKLTHDMNISELQKICPETSLERHILDASTGGVSSAIEYGLSKANGSDSSKFLTPVNKANVGCFQQQENFSEMHAQVLFDDSVPSFPGSKLTKMNPFHEENSLSYSTEGVSTINDRLRWQENEFHGGSHGQNGIQNAQLNSSINASLTMSLGPSPLRPVLQEPVGSSKAKKRNRDMREANKLLDTKRKHSITKISKVPSAVFNNVSKDSFDISFRVSQLPVEGRGKNQLLPRYWPRITEQELQRITPSGSNSSITPLFEKVLSASDTGKIGRLVLPKACAEAYFPTISQPEGVPLKILDVNGKEWSFQYRFWPNNNSRMYVLEGVTPCIQSMQLQAGDTVTFSRLDPEGKLVMGCRRAVNSSNVQEAQNITTGFIAYPQSSSSVADSMRNMANVSGPLLQGSLAAQRTLNMSEIGKEGQHICPKTRKLRSDAKASSDRSRLSSEELQELLQAPPHVMPSIMIIEGHEVEEYEEPPIFELDAEFSRLGSTTDAEDNEASDSTIDNKKDIPSGLEALVNAATMGETKTSSALPTTKHPCHRSGCTCIVCIQPPSGKGSKHKASCMCNVCAMIKRRFRTLMMHRKKRLLEDDAGNDTALHNTVSLNVPESFEVPVSSCMSDRNYPFTTGKSFTPKERSSTIISLSPSKGERHNHNSLIDLNCQPTQDEEVRKQRVSMMMPFKGSNCSSQNYFQQQATSDLICLDRVISCTPPGNVVLDDYSRDNQMLFNIGRKIQSIGTVITQDISTSVLEEHNQSFLFSPSEKLYEQGLGITEKSLDSSVIMQGGCLQNTERIDHTCTL